VRRRQFIGLLSGAAAWPLMVHAQQPGKPPTVGFLGVDASLFSPWTAAYHKGLKEAGFIEGQNITIEYHWAEGEYARLPTMATELVRKRVSVIVAVNNLSAQAAKAATTTIPVVFLVPDDPKKLGLVASLNRPGGNATGVNFLVAELGSKQLGLLHEMVPAARRVGLLVNPNIPLTESVTRDVAAAAASTGLQLDIVEASNSREIEAAFATLVRNKADALLVGPAPVMLSRRLQITTLATRHAIPTIYNVREYADVGGLMTYGTSQTEVYQQIGIYTGKILKGVKPADLPVMQSTKFELVINMPTARALGLDVPPTLLARADEVIE
jgi:putative ABC transport system substrate-binding protein